MTGPADREHLAFRLQEEIAATEAEITALEQTLQPRESDCGIGRMVNPGSIPGTPAAEEALRMASGRLQKLKSAQHRLHDSDFGICQACGNPIPVERLVLVPETRTCTACKR